MTGGTIMIHSGPQPAAWGILIVVVLEVAGVVIIVVANVVDLDMETSQVLRGNLRRKTQLAQSNSYRHNKSHNPPQSCFFIIPVNL